MAELRPGRQITPNLRLIRKLGRGGMGAVWLAEHGKLASQVVIKFLAADVSDDPSAVARFEREASAAAKVKSPHVVQMFDHGTTEDGTPYIVMEHLEGEDLSQRMRRGPLPLDEVAGMVEHVCRALQRAHDRGIIHRDIKPANIFLVDVGASRPLVKLLDFGIAKALGAESVTVTGDVVGTPSYLAPEQLELKNVDHRADLWALSVVTYRALTGQRLWGGESLTVIAVQILRGPIPKPSSVLPELPASVDAWFARACERDPDRRFQSARAMADALWEAVGRPEEASSSGVSRAPVSVAEESTSLASPAAMRVGGLDPTQGSLKSAVSDIQPAKRRPPAIVVTLLVAAVVGPLMYLASRALLPAPPAASSAASSVPTLSAAPPATASGPAPTASATAAPSASASATGSATAAPTPKPRFVPRARPRPAPVEDDVGF